MDEPGSSRQCRVCTAGINSSRFGLDACRACASFFKRSKISGIKYTCRQGDKKCATGKDERYTCRGCRFEKCIAIGMVWDGPMRIRTNKKIPILKRIKNELSLLMQRRREQELKIIKQHGGHKRHSHPTEELYYTHEETSMEMFRIYIAESREFFKNVYPAFSELCDREQELIFKDYLGKMMMVEIYPRAFELWGGPTKYQMFSVLTCYDIKHLPLLPVKKEHSDFYLSCSNAYVQDQHATFLPILKWGSFTEREYHALMALVVSEIDISGDLSEEAEIILENYRREALEDLQLYYKRDLGLRDFSTRIGNLMSANHAIQECKALFKIFYRLYSTVFVASKEDSIWEFYFSSQV